ncbi:type I glyceraldehyde-3-phosphate dehydrogenase [Amylibacter kogurei]|uniref:Glyceraldehyde-3-phosphate dehydrogenase n=1 Tax=Paramylibacter kogurei TaxID=1889778 RepID=A0A2G5KDF5_9RHOB|nr:type I glyceraldehyde-3-phosphate dehydrogenase [Amylibacter kogurei]PIB26860.1 type I glyceraldehyde-3-phosphate dehydrogenase [Amylibacter kogurei]
MTVKIAINGFGRIGRSVLRSAFESGMKDMQIVAINDLSPNETMAHLLRFDSVHGRFGFDVEVVDGGIKVDGQFIRVTEIRNPAELPWGDIDIAMECTGIFTARDKAAEILKTGAKRVLISAPGKDADKTIVFGVNEDTLTADDVIVSNASCTTNCLAPIAKVLNDLCGIKTGYMTTVHAFTGDQPTHDTDHKDLYRARAASVSMIPTSTGAAKAISLVLPELAGKLEGSAIRVPTPNVSLVDLAFVPNNDVTVEQIDAAMKAASEGSMKGILSYETQPKVSIDYNTTTTSSNYAAPQTSVTADGLVRVVSWYDNEWGFSNRMIDTARAMSKLL